MLLTVKTEHVEHFEVGFTYFSSVGSESNVRYKRRTETSHFCRFTGVLIEVVAGLILFHRSVKC